jgi:two-component system sensor histidine kinase UhpB
MLSPEQAIATLRIIQEAIANAIRHGDPRTITVRAVGAGARGHPEVCVFDDGRGAFQVGPHGGLRNMLARAQGSGLKLSFDFLPGSKMVRIEYPKAP